MRLPDGPEGLASSSAAIVTCIQLYLRIVLCIQNTTVCAINVVYILSTDYSILFTLHCRSALVQLQGAQSVNVQVTDASLLSHTAITMLFVPSVSCLFAYMQPSLAEPTSSLV